MPETAPDLPEFDTLAFEDYIEDVSDIANAGSIALLGMFKVGKTTLAATIAGVKSIVDSNDQVLILESESGTASIKRDFPGIRLMKLSNIVGFNRAVNELITKRHKYRVVIVDTYDKFQGYEVDYELALTPNDTRASYGRVKKWTVDTAWALHKAPFLVIFLFHETSEKDNTGKVNVTYKLAGSAGEDLGQVFDMIARLTVVTNPDGETQRVLQIGPAEGVSTGSRWEQELPNSMINPTMPKIFDLIEAEAAPAVTLTKE